MKLDNAGPLSGHLPQSRGCFSAQPFAPPTCPRRPHYLPNAKSHVFVRETNRAPRQQHPQYTHTAVSTLFLQSVSASALAYQNTQHCCSSSQRTVMRKRVDGIRLLYYPTRGVQSRCGHICIRMPHETFSARQATSCLRATV